jgi:fused signal recognition particle receptor
MDELKKIYKVIKKEHPDAPHETLIVLDATTGQNAVSQSKIFKETIDISGIVLTKLDGTAKGGVIVAVSEIIDIPVRYIGIGEQMDDLREFNAEDFVDAMFED